MAEMTYREALNQALKEEMRRDQKIIVLGEEVAFYQGAYKVTQGLLAEFGDERVKDTPISEEIIIGAAIGAAMGGLRPVAEMMTVNFSLLAMDQIVSNAAKIHYMFGGQTKVPMVIRAAQGAGKQLGAQHSQHLEAYFFHCPGLRVIAPATPADAKGLLKAAIRDDNPVIFLEDQGLYTTKGEVPSGDYIIPLGKANIIKNGEDITIISYSKMVLDCIEASKELENYNINAEIIDLRCLNPLDKGTIFESVKKTGLAIVVNEAWMTGSAAAEISCLITENCFEYLDAPVERISALDVPMPYNRELEQAALPHKKNIVDAALKLLQVNQ
ncbi:MAG: alpha-ketoacid dehydrogenase subunit beta [Candidatus Gastranaerophilales bacterium]|nr:alpha-ketoacid dehydrogenase subunit beta [Candidatus Gastranaerophilales bacterium]